MPHLMRDFFAMAIRNCHAVLSLDISNKSAI
ncbi:hypothetical protein BCh11DRAFT_00993 [Burkholderia sp. Ch1-1]|nr:hypothetical protein BCh11DRAFT_00993 [Burkholderia sp. Ch1-1]